MFHSDEITYTTPLALYTLSGSRAALSSGIRFSLALESILRMLSASDLESHSKRNSKYTRIEC